MHPQTSHCVVQWSGETLHLLAEHALWWPAAQTLFIADLHLGKAASYRMLGQPVPAGGTQDNLQRLSQLVERHGAGHIVFLGDFLHAAAGRTPAVLAALQAWRAQHTALRLTLVRGNHDSHAGDPPAELGVVVVDEPSDPPSLPQAATTVDSATKAAAAPSRRRAWPRCCRARPGRPLGSTRRCR